MRIYAQDMARIRAAARELYVRANLDQAFRDYWAAQTPSAERAAYVSILLFGGRDGYRFGWRAWVARRLRILALWVEE